MEHAQNEPLVEDTDVTDVTDGSADDEQASLKLADLKERIIKAGCNVKYPSSFYCSFQTCGVKFNDIKTYYTNPTHLASMIIEDFKKAVLTHFHPVAPTVADDAMENSLDEEIRLHRAYATNKARFFAGREKVPPPPPLSLPRHL